MELQVWKRIPVGRAAFIRKVIEEIFEVGDCLPTTLLEFILEQGIPTIAAKWRRAMMDDRGGKGGGARNDERMADVGPNC